MKLKERFAQLWHNYVPLIITAAVLIAIVLAAIFAQTAGIVSFIVVDFVVGYLYRNRIISKKALLQIVQNESDGNVAPFNSEYYDLYQEVCYNRLMVMLKSICLGLSVCPLIYNFFRNDLFSYIGISLCVIVITLFIACFFLSIGKRNEVLMTLISKRKENWFCEYTEKEIAILCQSEDCGEKTTNK